MGSTTTAPRTRSGAPKQRYAPPARISSPRDVIFLPHLLAFGLTLVALWVPDPRLGCTILSFTSITFAVAVTIGRAGPYLPPSSVFFLATGVFIGGASYYLLSADLQSTIPSIRDAGGLAMLTTVALSVVLTMLTSSRGLTWPAGDRSAKRADLHPPPLMFLVVGIVAAGLSLLPPVQGLVGPPARSFGLGGVIMMVAWASARRFSQRWFGDLVVIAMVFVLPFLWLQLTFTGGGRLQVAGLGVACFVAWNALSPRRILKVVVVLAVPLFLIYAGADRVGRGPGQSETSASAVVSDGQGLGSVYSPLDTFGEMIGPLEPHERDHLMPRYGATFLNALYLPIPRSAWPDKPKGFGAELTEVFQPHKIEEGHSMAALVQGEFYANFGYLGMPILVIVVGPILFLLDRWHANIARSDFVDERDWWSFATLLCLVACIGDFAWNGTFAAMGRGGLPAITVLLTGLVATRRRRGPGPARATLSTSSTTPSGAPAG